MKQQPINLTYSLQDCPCSPDLTDGNRVGLRLPIWTGILQSQKEEKRARMDFNAYAQKFSEGKCVPAMLILVDQGIPDGGGLITENLQNTSTDPDETVSVLSLENEAEGRNTFIFQRTSVPWIR